MIKLPIYCVFRWWAPWARTSFSSGRSTPSRAIVLGNKENERNFDEVKRVMKKWGLYDNMDINFELVAEGSIDE